MGLESFWLLYGDLAWALLGQAKPAPQDEYGPGQ